MNYDNAEPKVTKYLISNGDLIDESGNVIAHSDSLKDMYVKASPQVKKYLLSDGSVVDEDNNLIIKNDYFKKMYDQADPKVAKYLHADGTIDENESSSANLQDNKQFDITSNGTVEITPDANYDGMKKVTANVTVSGGGVTKLYAWKNYSYNRIVYTTVENPTTSDFAWDSSGDGKNAILDVYEEDNVKYIQLNLIDFE